MTHTFPIPRAGTTGLVFLIVIIVLLLLLAGWLFMRRGDSLAGAIIGMTVTLPLALMFAWFLVQQGRSTLVITSDSLALNVPWYGREIPLDAVLLNEIRLLEEPVPEEWMLKWRTNGIGLPDYQVGWFSTKGRHKVLAGKTRGRHVLIPTTKGYAIMVTLENPEAFMEALQSVEPVS